MKEVGAPRWLYPINGRWLLNRINISTVTSPSWGFPHRSPIPKFPQCVWSVSNDQSVWKMFSNKHKPVNTCSCIYLRTHNIYIYIYIYTFHFPINIYYHVFKPPISKHEIQRCPNISVWSAGGHPGHRCRFRRDAPLAGDTRRVAGHLLVRCGHASLSSGYRNGDIVGAYIYGLYLVAHRSD
jgi:hypothetical protein